MIDFLEYNLGVGILGPRGLRFPKSSSNCWPSGCHLNWLIVTSCSHKRLCRSSNISWLPTVPTLGSGSNEPRQEKAISIVESQYKRFYQICTTDTDECTSSLTRENFKSMNNIPGSLITCVTLQYSWKGILRLPTDCSDRIVIIKIKRKQRKRWGVMICKRPRMN